MNGQPNLSRGIQHRYLLVKESRFVREIAEKNMSFHKNLPQHRIFTQILEFSSFKHTNDQTELDNRHLHIILQFYRFLKPIQQNINEKSSSLREATNSHLERTSQQHPDFQQVIGVSRPPSTSFLRRGLDVISNFSLKENNKKWYLT